MVALLKEKIKNKKMTLLFFIWRKFKNKYNNVVSHYILYAMICKDSTNSSLWKEESIRRYWKHLPEELVVKFTFCYA